MTNPERIEHNPALIPPLQPTSPGKIQGAPGRTEDGKTFDEVLRSKVAANIAPARPTPDIAAPEFTVTWSAHASARLRQRGIELTTDQLQRLESAVNRAAVKGARDALVMMDDTAMVVSVKNRTVITALGKDQAKDNVFTNIDAAVIA
jgi:flagellar operon protein